MIQQFSLPSFARHTRGTVIPMAAIESPPAVCTTDPRSPDPAPAPVTMSRGEVARILGVTERWVRIWVTRYSEYFADGIDLSKDEIEKLRIIQRMAEKDEAAVRAALATA